MPSDMKTIPLIIERRRWQSRFFKHFPDDTAMMASNVLAATAPEKMLSAEMFGPAANASSASCVRSPNSARNVVVNELRIIAFAGIEVIVAALPNVFMSSSSMFET